MHYPNFESYITALYQQFSEHDALQGDRLKRYRNIEPESAQFLSMLIGIQQSKEILEIGTSTGYSTLWLAEAAFKTKGRVVTLEIDPERSAQAATHALALGLKPIIDFRVVDALDYLKQCTKTFDFILLDAERDAYVEYWQYLPHLLNQKNGVFIVDNVISHAADVQLFLQQIEADANFISHILPIGAGLLLVSYKSLSN